MRLSKAAATSLFAVTTSAQVGYVPKCISGLHVIVCRASTEAPGFGILGTVKDAILSRIPDSDAVWVPYPASILDPSYFISEPQGVGNMTALIQEYGDACPDGKMALLGYSQVRKILLSLNRLTSVGRPSHWRHLAWV